MIGGSRYRYVALAFTISLTGLFQTQALADPAASEMSYGPERVVNGSLEHDGPASAAPNGWEWSVQSRGDKATLKVTDANQNHGEHYAEIRFNGPDGIQQARLMQFGVIDPGKVYELSFRYCSMLDSRLHADVMLTGTGPMYRSTYLVPSANWQRQRVLFHVPASVSDQKPADLGASGEFGLFVQNRSVVPIRYDDLSLREVNLTKEQLNDFLPNLVVQPQSMADQLIFPDTTAEHAVFLPRLTTPSGNDISERWMLQPILLLPDHRVRRLEPVETNQDIQIALRDLPAGETTLIVQLYDRTTGDIYADHRQTLERIGDSEFTGRPDLSNPAVFRDRDGEAYFPIIMFGLSRQFNDQVWRDLRASGFNTVHDYGFEGRGDVNEARVYLDRAQQHGLRVMTGLPRALAENRSKHAELYQWLEEIHEHPSILFYYTDEMVGIRHTPLSTVEAVSRMIHTLDPNRELIVYDKPDRDFLQHVDGLVANIPSPSFATLLRLRMGDEKPYIVCLGQDHVRADPGPSAERLRYEMFMPVILGSRGMAYWMYSKARWHRSDPELLERVLAAAHELSQVAPAVISNQSTPEGITINTSGSIYTLTCTKDGDTYVLCGSPEDGQSGEVVVQYPSDRQAELLFETEAALDSQGHIALDVADSHVRIIKLSNPAK